MSIDQVQSRFMKQLRQGVAASIRAAALLSGMSTGASAAENAPAAPTPSAAPASAPAEVKVTTPTAEEYANCQRREQTPMKKLGQKLVSNMTTPTDRATATAELKVLTEKVKTCQAEVTARTNYSPRKP